MKNVQAIHIPTNNPTTGMLVENLKDLQEVDKEISINPLIFRGINKMVKDGIPVFINKRGGYCQVKDVYRIIGREDLN
jgi:hypothetical protein